MINSCPNCRTPINLDDPDTVGYFDVKDENGDEERFYWCHRCKVVFVSDIDWDSH